MKFTLEICANSLQSAMIAQECGADRIELCENLMLGGTTPSHGTIALTRKNLQIVINVLIRPRAGDFLYSGLEFETIIQDIKNVKRLGADGIVCGILLPDGNVDVERTKKLVELAHPLSFTFHRAFDFTPDPFLGLEDIIKTGAHRILTSGQQPAAFEGMHLIKELVKQSNNRIIIMPGGGVNADTIEDLIETGATEFHMSGTSLYQSGMTFKKPFMKISDCGDDYSNIFSDPTKIYDVVDFLKSK